MMNKQLETNNLHVRLILLFSFILITIPTPVFAQFTFMSFFCEKFPGTYAPDSTFEDNLKTQLLPSLVNRAELSTFDHNTAGQGDDKVWGLYYCRGDVNLLECHSCVDQAAKMITDKCQIEKEAIVWFDECMLRYANWPITSSEEESPWAHYVSKTNVSDPVQFGQVLVRTFDDLVEQAAHNETTKGFATGAANVTEVETVYCLVQCTPDILGSRCERCLRKALSTMAGCCGTQAVFVKIQFPSCQIHYDHMPFLLTDATRSVSPALAPPPATAQLATLPAKGGSTARLIRSYRDLFMISLTMASSTLFVMSASV